MPYARRNKKYQQGLVAEACKAAIKAHDLGWMYTIWVVQGQLWLAVGDRLVPQMIVATSAGPVTDRGM